MTDTHPPSPARKRRLWISAEIREEIEDILSLVTHSGASFTEIRVDAPRAVLESTELPATAAGARVIACPYDHATGISAIHKVRGLFSFGMRLLRHRPAVVFSGFSMMKHRLFTGVLRIPHLAYIRGVVFDPEVSVGISDRVRFGALRRLIPRRLVATYSADHVYTIGQVNRDFLLGRGIPADRIHVVGPVWLSSGIERRPQEQHPPTAYFVTGAWLAHGRTEEHDAQLALTRRLAEEWKGERRLSLRVHPRDTYDYESDPIFADVPLEKSNPEDFLASLSDEDILIAPLSTLAFEALHIGRKVVFYADPVATKAYFHIYSRLGIEAKTVDEILAKDMSDLPSPRVEVFSDIDLAGASEQLR